MSYAMACWIGRGSGKESLRARWPSASPTKSQASPPNPATVRKRRRLGSCAPRGLVLQTTNAIATTKQTSPATKPGEGASESGHDERDHAAEQREENQGARRSRSHDLSILSERQRFTSEASRGGSGVFRDVQVRFSVHPPSWRDPLDGGDRSDGSQDQVDRRRGVLAVAVVGGGTGLAVASGSDDEPLTGSALDRATAAALDVHRGRHGHRERGRRGRSRLQRGGSSRRREPGRCEPG